MAHRKVFVGQSHMKSPPLICLCSLCLCGIGAVLFGQEARVWRDPVHPGRNVEEFAPLEAKWLRFTILKTTYATQPCLDELEVYGPDEPEKNLALAGLGTQARASGTYPDYRIHALSHVNDGMYGNGHSWIADTPDTGWVELTFPAPARVNRVVWSRDRERKFIDRLPVEYKIEVAVEPGQWQEVASSADRAPLSVVPDANLTMLDAPGAFGSMSTDLSASDRPAVRDYLLKTWQIADGLPSNTITALCQTTDGWLWIGTTNGPARFDGQRFTVFGESHGLESLGVTCMLEDPSGRLWLGTEGGGLAFWDKGRFVHRSTGTGLAANTVLALAHDAENALWVGTADGLLRFTDEGSAKLVMSGRFSHLNFSEGKLWMIRGNVLASYNGTQGEELPAESDPGRFSSLSALASDGRGSLWFGGANGYIGRFAGGEVTTYGEGHPALSTKTASMLVTSAGEVWMGTSASGLVRLRGTEILSLTTDDGLSSNSLRALCEDHEGHLWVGTAGGGLIRLRARAVETLTTREGLSHNGIMAMTQVVDGSVWIGTNGGGLNRWHEGRVRLESPSYLLENKSISSVLERRDGSFWLGTGGTGAFRLAEGRLARFAKEDGLPGLVITALCEDSAGRLWVGTLDSGPALFADDAFTVPAEIEPLAGYPLTSLIEDKLGALWFGSNGRGVARLSPEGQLTQWRRGQLLVSDFVRTLYVDADGLIWAGTNGGLTCWSGDKVFSFTAEHGLPNGVVSQILEDEENNLWLGTNGGVFRISRESLRLVSEGEVPRLEILALGLGDGLPSLECTGGYQPAGLRMQDGRLCFGTVAGLAIVNPADMAAPRTAPPARVEAVVLGADTLVPLPTEPVQVPTAVSRLAFAFTAPYFTNPERLRFRYRLTGLESDWVEAGPERLASYTHLSPGSYRFEVVAKPDGGPWSMQPASVALHVLAPWWKSPWIVALLTGLCLAGTAGGARWLTRRRLQRRLREVERQFALERERSRIARDIHDDLGANLTQIGLLSALGASQSDASLKARERFEAIRATTEDLVQAMDSIVWAVNPSQDTLEGLARYLVRFAGDFFAAASVRLRVAVPEELPALSLSSEVRHNVFLAAKEALHNALHHAGASEVHLVIRLEGNRLVLEIVDNGNGFVPDALSGTGNGLGNIRQRLAECGGMGEIISSPGQGTCVRLTLMLPLTS